MIEPDGLGTRLRGDALAIVRAALRAVDPEERVAEALREDPVRPEPGGRLLVLAVGKAAPGMLRGVGRVWAEPPHGALAVVPRDAEADVPEGVPVWVGGHPLPDGGSLRAAAAVRAAVEPLGAEDRLLLLLSGGGSALLAGPAEGVGLEALRSVTRGLLENGATIDELNAVRKHLDTLKGGGLARLAAPAPVRALVISDVPGDDLHVVASGPVSPDPTTFAEAVEVLRARGLWNGAPGQVRARLEAGMEGRAPETPGPDDPVFREVSVTAVANAARAAGAAVAEAAALGYDAELVSVGVQGEAREVGARLGRLAVGLPPGGCRILAGETTVTVTGPGKGGRNQEVALGAAGTVAGREEVLVFSVGTDGVDGPTDAAGAWVTGRTLARGEDLGLDALDALRRNDAYRYFEALGDLVRTGPTGTNVMDLMGVLVARRSPGPTTGGATGRGLRPPRPRRPGPAR